MKKTNLMNTYLSNLAVLNVKLHNLHWNVTGIQFMPIHQMTEGLYDNIFAKFDDVAEQLKMLGEQPLATTQDYLAHATVKEVTSKDFSAQEVLQLVQEDLQLMRALATEIRSEANVADDFTTVALFEEHVADYTKNLWFLSAMLK